jgi:hypothetical protein
MRTPWDDKITWQRIGKSNVFVCIRGKHPAFGYTIGLRSDDGRWECRDQAGAIVLTHRSAEGAVQSLTAWASEARYEKMPRPMRPSP